MKGFADLQMKTRAVINPNTLKRHAEKVYSARCSAPVLCLGVVSDPSHAHAHLPQAGQLNHIAITTVKRTRFFGKRARPQCISPGIHPSPFPRPCSPAAKHRLMQS